MRWLLAVVLLSACVEIGEPENCPSDQSDAGPKVDAESQIDAEVVEEDAIGRCIFECEVTCSETGEHRITTLDTNRGCDYLVPFDGAPYDLSEECRKREETDCTGATCTCASWRY